LQILEHFDWHTGSRLTLNFRIHGSRTINAEKFKYLYKGLSNFHSFIVMIKKILLR